MSFPLHRPTLVTRGIALAERLDLSTMARIRARWAFRHAHKLGTGIRIRGAMPIIDCSGMLELGHHILFDSPASPTYLAIGPGALLSIGDNAYLNNGVWITAIERIVIGNRALIGPGVRIMDNAFHGISDRHRPASQPVIIDDDVWISSDVIINPGVHLGRGAVIGAHSVVTKDVPEFTVVAGAPAKEIRKVDRDELEASVGRGVKN